MFFSFFRFLVGRFLCLMEFLFISDEVFFLLSTFILLGKKFLVFLWIVCLFFRESYLLLSFFGFFLLLKLSKFLFQKYNLSQGCWNLGKSGGARPKVGGKRHEF